VSIVTEGMLVTIVTKPCLGKQPAAALPCTWMWSATKLNAR